VNNKKRFEPVDLDDLRRLFPGLTILHFTVDTASDSEDEWYVVGKSSR